jgi:uncharacterized peroxidase-related enzyme
MTHHGAGLRKLGADDELVRQLKKDFRRADLSTADRAMLEYAEKLALAPGDCIREDVETLRAAGFGDAEILDIVQVVGYYAYVNRMANGLGVELEDYWDAEEVAESAHIRDATGSRV